MFLLVLVGRSNSIRVDGQDLYRVAIVLTTMTRTRTRTTTTRGEGIAEFRSQTRDVSFGTSTSFRLYVPLELADAERGVSTRLQYSAVVPRYPHVYTSTVLYVGGTREKNVPSRRRRCLLCHHNRISGNKKKTPLLLAITESGNTALCPSPY